mgnify:CR=1 FL=1
MSRTRRGKSSVTVDPSDIASRHGHASCLLCGRENPLSLGLSFRPVDNDSVVADYRPPSVLQGYDGIVHGGMAAALLDAAMTHCLFHHGIRALTGGLHVRYKKPIPIETTVEIKARLILSKPPLYRLRAEIVRNDCLFASAEADFFRWSSP